MTQRLNKYIISTRKEKFLTQPWWSSWENQSRDGSTKRRGDLYDFLI